MSRILMLPGLSSSGPAHWQTLWERLDSRCVRVEQADWEKPQLGPWLETLERAIAQTGESPSILVAHSLGCALLARWAQACDPGRVVGALLVAPADVDSCEHTPACVRDFAPLPTARLPFPSILVASRNDPFAAFARCRELSEAWGARFVDAGAQGHLNADSGLGTWQAGRALLRELEQLVPFALHPRLQASGVVVAESGLSLLLLTNERRYPWLTLVPKVSGISELYELDEDDRARLLEESCAVARALQLDFGADKVNLGALGNAVRQLHIHHVARFLDDPAWPGPVWGHSARVPYASEELAEMRTRLAQGRLREWFRFA